ncbi:MAG: DNA-directed RNA polymerase subunit K [Sulfolobales archaeon]|nr:DNA-directed RNA polymerase subunit K [Sulfolobales archaeon]MCX8185601.1 DNA-directed RNA polymerase subunit K [Sulfolobales archaeon]MDW7969544.1 DNA-directed RNA polymerase subunit K [Sulfolobales archaeon]
MQTVSERLRELTGIKIGPPKLTKYEKARIISARALQLSLGAPPLIDISKLPKDNVIIAIEELKKGVLPITIIRVKPNGEKELIPARRLLELEEKFYRTGEG